MHCRDHLYGPNDWQRFRQAYDYDDMVGIFEQFYGIMDEIRFRFSQCRAVGRHHHLLVLEARSYVGHTASGQQQVVPVDPSAIPGEGFHSFSLPFFRIAGSYWIT